MDEQIMFEIAKSLNTIAGCMEARQKKEEENSNSAEKTQPSGETNTTKSEISKLIRELEVSHTIGLSVDDMIAKLQKLSDIC